MNENLNNENNTQQNNDSNNILNLDENKNNTESDSVQLDTVTNNNAINNVDSQNVIEQNNTPIHNINETPKQPKKNNNLIIILCTTVILILVGVIIFATFYIRNPKAILSKTLSDFYSGLKNDNTSTLRSILDNDIVTLDTSVELSIEGSGFEEQGMDGLDFSLNSSYVENKKDKKGYINIDSYINNEKFLIIDSLFKDNKAYFKIKDVFDEYYYEDYDFISFLNNKSSDDIKYLLNIFKDSAVNNLNKQKLKEESTTIKLDNKDTKVRKISLEITENLVKNILKDSLTEIKNNPKAKGILIENTNMKESNINKLLDEILNNLGDSKNTNNQSESIYYNIYVKGMNNTVKQELTSKDFSLAYYNYSDVKEFKIEVDNQDLFSIKFIGNEKGKITGILGGIALTGSYEKGKMNLDIPYNDMDLNISIENTEDEISKNKEYKNNFKILVSINNNNEKYNILLNVTSNYKAGGNIDDIDVSKSKKYSELTEEEINNLEERILNIPIINELASLNTQQDYYDYDDYTYEKDYDF